MQGLDPMQVRGIEPCAAQPRIMGGSRVRFAAAGRPGRSCASFHAGGLSADIASDTGTLRGSFRQIHPRV